MKTLSREELEDLRFFFFALDRIYTRPMSIDTEEEKERAVKEMIALYDLYKTLGLHEEYRNLIDLKTGEQLRL